MKTYQIIASALNIIILTGTIIAMDRHYKKRLKKYIASLNRRRGKIFDPANEKLIIDRWSKS